MGKLHRSGYWYAWVAGKWKRASYLAVNGLLQIIVVKNTAASLISVAIKYVGILQIPYVSTVTFSVVKKRQIIPSITNMQQKIIVWDLENFAWCRHLCQLKYSYKYIRKTKNKNKIKYRK